jgi:hypothetical protein
MSSMARVAVLPGPTSWTWRTAVAATHDTGKQGKAKLAMVASKTAAS